MIDFALAYFNTELDKLDVPALKEILEKVKGLIAKKQAVETPAEKFLKLSWPGDETAEEILAAIENGRHNSARFEVENEIFD